MTDWLVDEQLAPAATGELAPFYAAAAARRLDMPYCDGCGEVLELEQQICDACGSPRVSWRSVEAVGTVHSFTRVHRLEPDLIRTRSSYLVLDLELDSGHRIVLTTTGPTDTDPAIGERLQIAFRRIGGVQIPSAVFPGMPSLVDLERIGVGR
jgi:uncharacterized OB-fold protein